MTVRPDLSLLIPDRDSGSTTGVFSVAAIPEFDRHLVGRDDRGRACALLGSVNSGVRAPIRLSGLDIQYAMPCTLRMGSDGDKPRVLTVVTCTGGTIEAERYFLHIMGTLIEILGTDPKLSDVAEAATQLAGIFQRLSLNTRESVAGVIGELLLIECACDPVAAVAGWRNDVAERYDFVAGDLRLEVKSSLGRRRTHSFSFEQCDVPAGCFGIVASVFVEHSKGGLSLEALLDRISARLKAAPASIFALEQTLANTLGAGLAEALSFNFDYALARASFAYYDLASIPAVRGPLDPCLSQVRFVADLSQSAMIEPSAIHRECSDFAAFRHIESR